MNEELIEQMAIKQLEDVSKLIEPRWSEIYTAIGKACCEAAEVLKKQQQIIEKQASLNQKLADMALELDQVKAERDEYFEQLRGLCFCCGHKTDGFDCHAKCYGHRRGTAWIYVGPQKEE
ncbi:MAG: hypothetical protein Q4P84_08020 [Elusimicrobiales bacterium]|nr:hypothetical protein [Elusimicrobiales bacterium]